jgi:hypothetical protein
VSETSVPTITEATADFRLLVDELQVLISRSRRRPWRAPLLCVNSTGHDPDGDGDDPLDEVARLLDAPDRQVPHVRLSAGDATTPTIVDLLNTAYERLAERRRTKRLQFPRYRLLRQIMAIDLRDVTAVEKREKVLARRLVFNPSGWVERNPWISWAPESLQRLLAGVAAFLAIFPAPAWQLAHWRRARWMMRQPFAFPRRSGAFASFAVRLTTGRRDQEDPAQLDLLLVHAFLQDLRHAYGRWRGPRRTAYPVILFDDAAAGSVTGSFLELVNQIRNRVGDDPLVVIVRTGPAGLPCPVPSVPLSSFPKALAGWQQGIEQRRGSLTGPAWFLQVDVPARHATPPPDLHPPRPSRLTSPITAAVAAVLVAAVIAVTAVPIVRRYVSTGRAGCPTAVLGSSPVRLTDNQCVGLSDSTRIVFGSDPAVRRLQNDIYQENAVARERWSDRPDRPIITLIYLSSLTRADADRPGEETFIAEREGLTGMLAAQKRADKIADSSASSPYVQILVANTGNQGAYTDEVVTTIINRARSDKQIVAIIAAIDSRTIPVAALHRLGDSGLPVITPSMTADGIDVGASLFLQIDPPVTQEAALTRDYTQNVLKKHVLINYFTYGGGRGEPGNADLYVDTLRTALGKAFGRYYHEHFWVSGADLTSACRPDAVVFFGGRYSELADFLDKLNDDCSGRIPSVVADGSAARYMANQPKRQTAPANMALAFISEGFPGTCENIAEPGLPVAQRHSTRQNYLQDLGRECADDRAGQAAGWNATTYDATGLITRAMQDTAHLFRTGGATKPWQPGTIQAPTLYQQILKWSAKDPYLGVTGPIWFDDDHGGVAADRYLGMLCASSIRDAYRTADATPPVVDALGTTYLTDPKVKAKPCTPA